MWPKWLKNSKMFTLNSFEWFFKVCINSRSLKANITHYLTFLYFSSFVILSELKNKMSQPRLTLLA